jgi:L-aminopeptidase/D-esterase-like protein
LLLVIHYNKKQLSQKSQEGMMSTSASQPGSHGDITDVAGVRVGHDTLQNAPTGCTVVLFDTPATGSVEVCGGAPGTRETDVLGPVNRVSEVHGIVLTGGSAFGLDVASGVVRALERLGIGFDTGFGLVPIVPAAVIFDLGVNTTGMRPDGASGERAVAAAASGPIAQGRVGAGTGATINKLGGLANVRPGGVGSASQPLYDDFSIGALVVVNALGTVDDWDPQSDDLVAFRNNGMHWSQAAQNTTIAVIATNANLDKPLAARVAKMATAGIARVIRPAFTPFDGDVVFAMSIAEPESVPATHEEVAIIGAAAASVLARAILRAVQ